jgi:hypothetical protein
MRAVLKWAAILVGMLTWMNCFVAASTAAALDAYEAVGWAYDGFDQLPGPKVFRGVFRSAHHSFSRCTRF